ncbi:GNAT family N-acetyltransferase [Sulfurihydrogenibium sp.]|uniref:GNAT family N-acetyltransferase n=1 Tax=Sulfurihydrogenibium sp. TaxID=2053621 RepID=UPI00262F7E38|nr:GNAT family N-acetyltransferase [Sulfurihydrogenibium sp.]
MIKIEKKTKLEDIKNVAQLHKLYISSGFISSLGNKFLVTLYDYISKSDNSFCIVAKYNENIIGFISGTQSISELYKGFFKEKFLEASFTLFPQIFKPKNFFKLIETILYPKKKSIIPSVPDAELLSIVVDKNFQGKGISSLLFNTLVEEFKKRKIYSFKIVVGSNLTKAIRFYEKMGCKKIAEIEIHKGEKSYIYVYNIKSEVKNE